MEIRDKVALVTGSTRGIGRAIGEKLCRLGSVVYFNSHNSRDKGIKLQAEFQQDGLKAFYVECDVSSEEEVRNIFEVIKNEQGRWQERLLTYLQFME
ncbi:SDR family NAD(P)-dependent oxidoreductase [Candidatus Woesearchaeota archaeon]|nr:SDR family NAD(P)-dependent oxidoreductase [Candidatus Woesearchaeota archaeon]